MEDAEGADTRLEGTLGEAPPAEERWSDELAEDGDDTRVRFERIPEVYHREADRALRRQRVPEDRARVVREYFRRFREEDAPE